MGKRSNYPKIEKDKYMTIDPKAITPWVRQLIQGKTYYEPCVGNGDLVNLIGDLADCSGFSDIETGKDALTLSADDIGDCDLIVTNPPWTRDTLHPLITHFISLKPTLLLFDADWAHTKQALPYLEHCVAINSVGRLQWIPDTKMKGKDNCAWYFFQKRQALPELMDYYPTFIPNYPEI